MSVEVVRRGGRFVAVLDGADAGYAEVVEEPGALRFTHTVVDPASEGRGVGSALVRAGVDAARAQGLAVLPQCTFVRAWLLRHPDDAALVPEDQRAAFGL